MGLTSLSPSIQGTHKFSLDNFALAPRRLKLELTGGFVIFVEPQLFGERGAAVRCVVFITDNQHLRTKEMIKKL